MRVQLLGAFGVEVSGQRVDPARWRLRKARTAVKLLALEPDPPATYRRLVEVKDRYDPDNLFQLDQNIQPFKA